MPDPGSVFVQITLFSLKSIVCRYADTMNRISHSFITVAAIIALAGSTAIADAVAHPATREEKDFYLSTIVPALNTVKKAMPPAPEGWIIAGETKIQTDPPDRVSADIAGFQAVYRIAYRRIVGVREEQQRLDDLFAESSNRNREAAKPRIDELIRQQTETSLALRKATRRRNQAEMERLNNELDENGRKMRAVHENVDRKISLDVAPHLVKDAEASILVSLNDASADLPQGEPLKVPRAAYALRKEGERAGLTSWREGKTLILFGAWEPVKEGRYRTKADPSSFPSKVRTVKIVITGDRKRAEDLIGKIDIRAILGLMK